MFRLFGLLLVGLVLSGLSASPAFADVINCERTSNDTSGWKNREAFESVWPKEFSLPQEEFIEADVGSKAMLWVKDYGDGWVLTIRLLPNKKALGLLKSNARDVVKPAIVRYRCDAGSNEVRQALAIGVENAKVAETEYEYVGFYDYSIACKDKNWRKNKPGICSGQKFSMKSTFRFDGKKIVGEYTAKETDGATFYGEYVFTKFSFKKSSSTAELRWQDKWGDGKLNLRTDDDWNSFSGEWFYPNDGRQEIRGLWNAQRKNSSSLNSPIQEYALFVRGDKNGSSNDIQTPRIVATTRWDSQTNAVISGQVTDNVAVAEVTIDGEPVGLGNDGLFSTSLYVPRNGKTVEIIAFDKKGNKATKSLFIERGEVQEATGPVFASLNPSGKRVKSNKDALALIIGVADYQRTPAKAAYADKDAQTFYDYAMLKLGIPTGNIKELVNVKAGRVDVSLAIKDWIARSTKQGQSDIYIFFAGHGLANQSGEEMYLLPYDGSPRLLEDSAISRERLFADISAANPRSVTVFLDTCYSGTTRGTDMLIASRPIAIRAIQQSIPDNFTVMTAAAGDQTAKPLEEAKHGMFSYFLIKGTEGEADANNDNEITAGELHSYVQTNVIQQSSGSQTPELQGDADRVLVRFQ